MDVNITGDTSEDSDNQNVEQHFKKFIKLLASFYLNSMQVIFRQRIKNKSCGSFDEESGLTKGEFIETINEVFGAENYTTEAIELYKDIDKDENSLITWLQLLDYLTYITKIKPYPKLEFGNYKITPIPHVMRDTIMKIVLIETDKYFCYAIISKYGRIGLYDGNMNFLISYHVIMTKDDITRTDEERRRRNRWITDAIYLPDVFMLFITNSTRSITIYDASGLKHVPIWLIIGYPNIICAVSYYFQESSNTCTIYVGDETGLVTSFNFLQSKVGLLRRKHNDKLNIFYWIDIPNENEYISVKNMYKAHNDMIRKLKYMPNEKVLISCSRDAKRSVVIKSLIQKRNPYIFKMRRGSNCFVLTKSLLITGSDDGIIRMWNPVITSKPLAILNKHVNGIVDLIYIEFLQFFISCSRDGVLKLWDVKSETSIQTETFKFPSFKINGKTIEWGINSIYPGPKRINNLNRNDSDDTINENDQIWQHEKYRDNFDLPVLIPPPLQNSVLIPNSWKATQERHVNKEELDRHLDDILIDDELVEKRLESLRFILDKNILDEFGLKSNINQKIARLEAKKSEMQLSVDRCAPFLALDLHEHDEIKLDKTLPMPNRKKIRNLIESTHRMLSAASTRSQIFSEQTTSSRLSSRSSIMEFD